MTTRLLIPALVTLSLSPAVYAQSDLQPHITHTMEAEESTSHSSTLRKDNLYLSNIFAGDWFSINTESLDPGIDTITMRYAGIISSDANLEIRQGSLTGPIIASGKLVNTQSFNRFRNSTFLVNGLSGSPELFFIFSGQGEIATVDNVNFGRSQKNVLEAENSFNSFGVFNSGDFISRVDPGDWLRFRDVQFGNGFSNVAIGYRKLNILPFIATFHLDDLDGPVIGSVNFHATGRNTEILTGDLVKTEGTHDIFVRFSGLGRLPLVDSFSFEEQPASTKLKVSDADAVRGFSYSSNQEFLNMESEENHWFRFNQTSGSYNPEIELKYAKDGNHPMRLEIRKTTVTGRLIGTIDLPTTGSLDNFKTIKTRLNNSPQGIYNLVFNVVGEGGVTIGDINLTRFGESDVESFPDEEIVKSANDEPALDKILIDQFGYRPEMAKVAILRDGEIGLGSDKTDYIPGDEISLIDETSNKIVFSGLAESYLNGAIDPASGDRVWSFDFSEVKTPGTYFVFDAQNNVRSASFVINENIYQNVLREAFRTFVYQRSGFEKSADIVGENYVDDASHIGPLQDSGARLYNARRRRSTERDLSGGWYDAGDFNKYSNWTADYILGLLHAYHANPDAWADDWNMPDSGNGIPDILDEVRWGVEQLQRMQETASEVSAENVGAVLSVLESDDSINRPSDNLQDSFYGPPSTSATFNAAGAFAFAASTFETLLDQTFRDLAESLSESAISAYDWAERNPNIKFNNAENGVGAGNSEVSQDYFLDAKRRIGAIYLYGLTQEQKYKNFIETDYRNTRLIKLLWASPYESEEQTALLHYATLSGINPAIGTEINNRFNTIMETAGNARPALEDSAYKSYVQEYVWGSNRFVSRKGGMFTQLVSYDLSERPERENMDAAAGYLHYIHGLNPLGKVYLSNMNNFGAERSVDEFYHVWFNDGTEWDNVNTSFGPPPGFLVGGPNQFYSGGLDINQPPMKSYIETNASSNNEQSWQLTENSNGYQIEYLRLLSQFVK